MEPVEAGPSRPSPRQADSPGKQRRKSWFGLGSANPAQSSNVSAQSDGQENDGRSHSQLDGSDQAEHPGTFEEVIALDDDWQVGETGTIRKKKKKKRRSLQKGEVDGSDEDDGELLRMRHMAPPTSSRRVSETTIRHSQHEPSRSPDSKPPDSSGGSDSANVDADSPNTSFDIAYIPNRPFIPPRSTSTTSRPHPNLHIDKTQPATPADRPLPPLPAHNGGGTPPGSVMPREIVIIPSSPRTPLTASATPRQPIHHALGPSSTPSRSPDSSTPASPSSIGIGRPGLSRQHSSDVPPPLPEKPVSVSTPARLRAPSPVPKIVFAEPDEKLSLSGRSTPTQENRARVRRARSLSGLWKGSPTGTPVQGSSREASRSNSPEPIDSLEDERQDVEQVIVKATGVLGWLGVKKTIKRRQSEGRLPKAAITREKQAAAELGDMPPPDSRSTSSRRPSAEAQPNPLIPQNDQPPVFDPGSSINTVIAPSPGRLSTFFSRRPSARDEEGALSDAPVAAPVDLGPSQARPIPNHHRRPRPRPATAGSSQSSLQLDEDNLSPRPVFEGEQWTNTPTEVEETLQSPQTSSNWGPGMRPWMTGSDAFASGSSSGISALDSLPEKSVLETPSQSSPMRPPTLMQNRARAWSDAPRPANAGSHDSASYHLDDQPPPRSLQPSPFEGSRPKMPGRSSSGNAAIIGRMRSAFSRNSTKGKSPQAPARDIGDTSEFGAFQPQNWASGGYQMRPSSSSSSDVESGRSRSRARRGILTRGSGQNALLDLLEGDRQVFLNETPERSPRTSLTAASVSSVASGSTGQSGNDLLNRKGRARASTLSAAPSSSSIGRPTSPPPVLPFAATPPRRRSSAILRISHGLLSSGASSPRSSTLFPLPPRSSGSLSSSQTNRLGSPDELESGSASSVTSPRRSGGSAPGTISTADLKALSIKLSDESPEQYLDRISHVVGNGDIATVLASR